MEQDEPVCEMVTERRCNGVNGNIVIIVATTLHGGGGGGGVLKKSRLIFVFLLQFLCPTGRPATT